VRLMRAGAKSCATKSKSARLLVIFFVGQTSRPLGSLSALRLRLCVCCINNANIESRRIKHEIRAEGCGGGPEIINSRALSVDAKINSAAAAAFANTLSE
jgi:hypothetical protein